MNYSSVIRQQDGRITQPQSCAFLHGVDWMRSTLDRRSLSATLVWSVKRYRTLWTPLGLHKAGSFITHLRSSCVVPGTSLGGRLCREKGLKGGTDVTMVFPNSEMSKTWKR
ncbi:hypothetical protein AVEN_264226-1 [Araneus ventricosus]|uniref:Uncharacterized protein n=1 Tax=Araneus ventricosus TaxID=182803 RepID=A0A4Y2J158_ARAVE|nr:hypothetical protein AVEN_264226-1 [Araneus ventricosus]